MSDVCETRGHDWLILEDHMLCARCDLTTGLPVVEDAPAAVVEPESGPVDVPAVIADIRKKLRGGKS